MEGPSGSAATTATLMGWKNSHDTITNVQARLQVRQCTAAVELAMSAADQCGDSSVLQELPALPARIATRNHQTRTGRYLNKCKRLTHHALDDTWCPHIPTLVGIPRGPAQPSFRSVARCRLWPVAKAVVMVSKHNRLFGDSPPTRSDRCWLEVKSARAARLLRQSGDYWSIKRFTGC